jgi:hypothetical protein
LFAATPPAPTVHAELITHSAPIESANGQSASDVPADAGAATNTTDNNPATNDAEPNTATERIQERITTLQVCEKRLSSNENAKKWWGRAARSAAAARRATESGESSPREDASNASSA